MVRRKPETAPGRRRIFPQPGGGLLNTHARPRLQEVRDALRIVGARPSQFCLPTVAGMADSVLRLVALGLLVMLARAVLTDGGVMRGRWAALLRSIGAPSLRDLIIILVVASVAQSLCAYIARLSVARGSVAIEERMSVLLLRQHLRYGQQYFDLRRLGPSARRFEKVPSRVSNLMPILSNLAVAVTTMAVYGTVLAWLWWQLAAITILFLAIYFAGFTRLSHRLEALSRQVDAADDDASATATELVMNLPLVRLCRMQDAELAAWANTWKIRSQARRAQQQVLEVIGPLKELFTVLVLVLIVSAGAASLSSSSVSVVSRAAACFLILRRCVGAFSRVLQFPDDWSGLRVHLERLQEFLDDGDKYIVPDGSLAAQPVEQALTFHDLEFAYARKGPALQGVRARIPARDMTAIVGRTGSGKSTLLRLLLRHYDCPPGTIRLDGVDLREFRIADHLARVAYAGSEPEFFDTTIRANVCYGLTDVSEERLVRAARQAQALAFIQELEHGFDETVGEAGQHLSTGERQRLALMRVFLREPEIVLLDEATSALDLETEARVLEELRDWGRERTVVMITHRLSGLDADTWVVVMEAGRVSETGRLGALAEAEGPLAALLRVRRYTEPGIALSRDRAVQNLQLRIEN